MHFQCRKAAGNGTNTDGSGEGTKEIEQEDGGLDTKEDGNKVTLNQNLQTQGTKHSNKTVKFSKHEQKHKSSNFEANTLNSKNTANYYFEERTN